MLIRRIRVALLTVLSVSLAVTATAAAQAVTKSYNTDSSLQRGMIVRLTEKDKSKVEALKSVDISKMEGVIVAANDSPVTLSSTDVSKQQVFVATTGRYYVLVSNQNGPIKKDDYITISSLAGVGMKAGGDQSHVVGRAISGFDGVNNLSGKTEVKNGKNEKVPITLGLAAVDINIGRNPVETKRTSLIPGLEFIRDAAGQVVNKDVSPSQLYLAMAALIVTAFVAGAVLYSGVRSSMTAIGRNPLAKATINRSLFTVILTSIIILIIGITAVYLILKL